MSEGTAVEHFELVHSLNKWINKLILQNTELERKNKVLMEYFEANESVLNKEDTTFFARFYEAREAVRNMLKEGE